MPNDPLDLLQIKIDKARGELPPETRAAIDAVDWKATILQMREKKGYTFEQLGDLELETELLLAGLVSAEDYPKELEKRMKIPKTQVDALVSDMNELVLKKIREEFIKRTEIPLPSLPLAKGEEQGGGMVPHPILAQKLSSSFQIPKTTTQHSLGNISKPDPYREVPE